MDDDPFAAGFFAAAFLVAAPFAALAFAAADVPVTAFLAEPRFDGVVVFLGAGLAFVAVAFLVVVAFFAGAGLIAGFAFTAVLALDVEVLEVVGLVVDLTADFFTGADFLGATAVLGLGAALGWTAGLLSLAAATSAALALGVSFTRPDGPLGRRKISFSAPRVMALESCEI